MKKIVLQKFPQKSSNFCLYKMYSFVSSRDFEFVMKLSQKKDILRLRHKCESQWQHKKDFCE